VMRKIISVLVALAAVAGAATAQRGINENQAARARTAARTQAEAGRQRTTEAVQAFRRAAEGRAQTAAALPQLRGQLALLRNEALAGEVAATLADWFRSEPEGEPFRKEFPIYAISADDDKLGLTVGAPAEALPVAALVAQARERGSATGVVAGERPLATAAARVPVPGRAAPAVLVLARPIDGPALQDLAARAGGTLLLAREGEPVSQRGDEAALKRLAEAARQPPPNDLYVPRDGTWAASPLPMPGGFQLWSYSDASGAAAALTGSLRATRIIVWAVGGFIAILALWFGLRRATPAPELAPAAGTSVGRPLARLASDGPVLEAGTPGPLSLEVQALTQQSLAAPAATGPLNRYARESSPAANEPAPAPSLATEQTSLQDSAALSRPTRQQGRSFGRYVLVDRLGEGGMSQVYTAVVFGAEGFRRKFVIKRLRPEYLDDATVVASFIDEANLASSLVHSNIVPVLDFGKVGDEYFLATEYILGRDLGRITQQLKQRTGAGMPVSAVLHAAHEVLDALEYAHSRTGAGGSALGIVHRDVSPNNVLVSARGEVKLFDFGIVKAEGRVTRTQQGVVKGNVSFMSPEQARGLEVDARADLFSLGLVIYYCLTGEVLYQGATSYELLLKAATGPGADEIPRLRGLPEPAGAILARALASDPAARFASASEFSAALAPHIAGGAAQLASLMRVQFAEDFRQEEERFAGAIPSATAPAPGSTGGSQSGGGRQTS
jgi:tRNA A-37 threonylcarbamoyl transferase component Bud32